MSLAQGFGPMNRKAGMAGAEFMYVYVRRGGKNASEFR